MVTSAMQIAAKEQVAMQQYRARAPTEDVTPLEQAGELADGTGQIDRTSEYALDDWMYQDLPLIVHDLKSPLSAITLEMNRLLESTGGGAPHAVHEIALRVLRNIEFVDRMVQDLLDSAALDAGQLGLQRTATDLSALVHRVVERVVSASDRGRVVLEDNGSRKVPVDQLCIERVLANLIQNAFKYAPRASTVRIRVELSRTMARVAVIDDGPGIAAEDVGEIFQRFGRAPSARVHEGSGLGLYVSRQMIEAHGGQLHVSSNVGEGACFYFELPVE